MHTTNGPQEPSIPDSPSPRSTPSEDPVILKPGYPVKSVEPSGSPSTIVGRVASIANQPLHPNQPPDLSRLPPWQHRYLIARSVCDNDWQAVRRARVSVAIVEAESKRNPLFARLRQAVIERTLVLGVDEASRVARDEAAGLVSDAIAESRDLEIAPRDRRANRHDVFEVLGLTSQRQEPTGGPISASQLTIAIQLQIRQEQAQARQATVVKDKTRARGIQPKSAPQEPTEVEGEGENTLPATERDITKG